MAVGPLHVETHSRAQLDVRCIELGPLPARLHCGGARRARARRVDPVVRSRERHQPAHHQQRAARPPPRRARRRPPPPRRRRRTMERRPRADAARRPARRRRRGGRRWTERRSVGEAAAVARQGACGRGVAPGLTGCAPPPSAACTLTLAIAHARVCALGRTALLPGAACAQPPSPPLAGARLQSHHTRTAAAGLPPLAARRTQPRVAARGGVAARGARGRATVWPRPARSSGRLVVAGSAVPHAAICGRRHVVAQRRLAARPRVAAAAIASSSQPSPRRAHASAHVSTAPRKPRAAPPRLLQREVAARRARRGRPSPRRPPSRRRRH